MQNPFDALKPEYTQLLAMMKPLPAKVKLIDEVATRLLTHKAIYQQVTDADGVPVIFIATSFEREASSNFSLNPAQGWPLHSQSKWIPHNGPFPDWKTAAIAAYHLNHLDTVGAANWTWELICYYGELFNGMGYRDYHHMRSPYLWGGTNLQQLGKYTSDGKFDASHMDEQLGIIPVARRMVELDEALALTEAPLVIPPPISSGIAAEPESGTTWVQESLNKLGFEIAVDGNYGKETKSAVESFQKGYGLTPDGLVGPLTTAAIKQALTAVPA